MADPTGFNPEHLGTGGLGALLTALLLWASKLWKGRQAESKAEGRQAEKFRTLETGQAELRQDMRDFRAEYKADMRELRELLTRQHGTGD